MLILSIVTTTLLLMMTQHRVWVFAGIGGAVCSWGLSQLVTIFERILPPDWHVFNGSFGAGTGRLRFIQVPDPRFWVGARCGSLGGVPAADHPTVVLDV